MCFVSLLHVHRTYAPTHIILMAMVLGMCVCVRTNGKIKKKRKKKRTTTPRQPNKKINAKPKEEEKKMIREIGWKTVSLLGRARQHTHNSNNKKKYVQKQHR